MNVCGILIVRKEAGMTSFGVVSQVRRIFGMKKVGHTGTLDPDAEGVLPVCLGRATRLVEDLSRGTKTYEAVMRLGVVTDTQDLSGTVLSESSDFPGEEEIRSVMMCFEGPQLQTPPMYSALKVNGKKLYELARKGIEVDRKPREVCFSELRIRDISLPEIRFSVSCTHGSYIRTLCHDIGQALGCGAVMSHLLRTRVESFTLAKAHTLAEIARMKEEEDAAGAVRYSFLIPADSIYEDLPAFRVRDDALKKCLNGVPLSSEMLLPSLFLSHSEIGDRARFYTEDGAFIGLFRLRDGEWKTERYFYEGSSQN